MAGTGFFTGRPLPYVKQLDQIKQEACKKLGKYPKYTPINTPKGITLISVPFWWNSAIESLKASIYRYRPDLFETAPLGDPFPEYSQKLADELKHSRKLPEKQTVEQKIALALRWSNSMDPTGW
jgi:hypothetical protein